MASFDNGVGIIERMLITRCIQITNAYIVARLLAGVRPHVPSAAIAIAIHDRQASVLPWRRGATSRSTTRPARAGR
jgi:hypothetical protein